MISGARHPVLMSHFMNVLERHGLGPTKTVDEVLLDQLQSAYQPHLTVGDAVTHLLQKTHLDTFHLDSYGSTEGITPHTHLQKSITLTFLNEQCIYVLNS